METAATEYGPASVAEQMLVSPATDVEPGASSGGESPLEPRSILGTWRVQAALSTLAGAAAYAADAEADKWQFAVGLPMLRRLGLSLAECRWLISKGLAAHAVEITELEDTCRTFQSCSNLALPKRTCFVITDEGARAEASARRPAQIEPGTDGADDSSLHGSWCALQRPAERPNT